MIQTIDIPIDVRQLKEYFETLKTKYQHYHWYYEKDHNDPRAIMDKHALHSMHGYGLQTIYEDITFPYHVDIDPHDEGPEYFRDTELIFGFFKDIKSKFNNVYRSFVMTFPPGNHIAKWTGGSIEHSKIFIPIESNGTEWLRCHSTIETRVIPEVGKAYKIEMVKNRAELINDGDTDISLLVFNVKE